MEGFSDMLGEQPMDTRDFDDVVEIRMDGDIHFNLRNSLEIIRTALSNPRERQWAMGVIKRLGGEDRLALEKNFGHADWRVSCAAKDALKDAFYEVRAKQGNCSLDEAKKAHHAEIVEEIYQERRAYFAPTYDPSRDDSIPA